MPPLQENLRQYVDRVFSVITASGVSCPTVMCDIFFSLREAAAKRFQGEALARRCRDTCTPPQMDASKWGGDFQGPVKGVLTMAAGPGSDAMWAPLCPVSCSYLHSPCPPTP